MTTLILTVAGSDRPGLVAAVADIVDAHGGNWESSQLAELAGVFAGVIQVSVAPDREAELQYSLRALDGTLAVTVHTGADASTAAEQPITLQVLGNDRPGIVREVSAVLRAHELSIQDMTTETRDAAMAGGRLFEASVAATVPASADLTALRADLERLTAELQVDITLD
ncbi:ACT domain-containing protein [Microbacterium sp. Bi121]|uniref:glycine cleavage system protein R n=1 Tax=Microbacterium sp. Bi121 TaxID=2822348 RepID=UPI001D6579AA|nr:ACT domain-containing protein [Microbacterium sp. Bi121]CAH0153844.1 Glycine cleavage system transcriptional repressor [Microbacterium sp. Bi121]